MKNECANFQSDALIFFVTHEILEKGRFTLSAYRALNLSQLSVRVIVFTVPFDVVGYCSAGSEGFTWKMTHAGTPPPVFLRSAQ